MAIKIKFQKPPVESLGALKKAAEGMKTNHSKIAESLQKVISTPEDHSPHPVLTVDINEALAGRALSSIKRIAWRYLSNVEDASIEVHDRGSAAGHEFSHINSGPLVSSTHEGLQLLEKLGANSPDGNYNISILRIMPLYVYALLLQAENLPAIILPIGKNPSPLKSKKLYTAGEFDTALKEIAEVAAKNPFNKSK